MQTFLPKLLKITEVIAILIAAVGYVFKRMHWVGANDMLLIGLFALAATYFLSGFMFVPMANDNKQKSFLDLLPTVLRKLLYIGLSVTVIGFLFAILHLAGSDQMLLIGIGTLTVGTLVAMALVLGNRDRMVLLQAPLIRSVAYLLVFLLNYLF